MDGSRVRGARLLEAPTSTDAQTPLKRLGKWLVDPSLGRVAAVFVAVIYLLLSLSYNVFYTAVGLHPDDVGASRTYILTQAAAAVVAIFVLVVLLSIVRILSLLSFWRSSKVDIKSIRQYVFDDRGPRPIRAFLRVSLKLGELWIWDPLLSLLPNLTTDETGKHLKLKRARFTHPLDRGYLVRTFIVSGVTIIVSTGIYVGVSIHTAASTAQSGGVVKPIRILGLTLIDVEAVNADVLWTGSTPAPALLTSPGTITYLGRSAQVVYLRKGEETIEVPSSDVTVVLQG